VGDEGRKIRTTYQDGTHVLGTTTSEILKSGGTVFFLGQEKWTRM